MRLHIRIPGIDSGRLHTYFKTPGPKVLHTEIQIADELPQDNRRSTALNALNNKVLLVDGDPSDEWLRGSDFLDALALRKQGKQKQK